MLTQGEWVILVSEGASPPEAREVQIPPSVQESGQLRVHAAASTTVKVSSLLPRLLPPTSSWPLP